MSRGISLLELTVGMVVTAVAFIGFSRVTGIASRAQKNSVLRVQADQQMRAFLESQKKHIA